MLAILFGATTARAHSVTLECEVQPPDRVVVIVYFGGTEPAVGAAIVVTDAEGHEVASGTSDRNGSYTFTATAKIAYTLEATIAGHRARRQLSSEEVAQLDPQGGSSGLPTTPPPTSRGLRDLEDGHEHRPTARCAHVHPPPDSSHTEAVAGVALILSAASLLMIVSLRRRLDTHIKRDHNAQE